MTAFRLISFPTHAALETLLGLLTMVAPFVLGFGSAGTLVAVVVGALITGLALSAAVADDTNVVDIGAHYAYDLGLCLGLLGAGLALGIAGDAAAAVFLTAAAAAQLSLTLTTRYSARR